MQPMLKNYKKKNPQISQSRFLKVKVLALKKIIFWIKVKHYKNTWIDIMINVKKQVMY